MAQGVDRSTVRHRVGWQHPGAEVVARAHRSALGQGCARQAGVEPPGAATVVGAGDVITAHVLRQRQVGLRVGAHPFGRELESPDFGRAKVLHDLRAGLGGQAAAQDAGTRQPAHGVRVWQPPLRTLAAGLVELQHPIGLCPAEVQCDATARDDRPQPVMHHAPGLGLVEAQVKPAAQIVARLRDAASDAAGHHPGQGVGGARIVLLGGLKEVAHIAPGGKPDAQHVGVGRGEHHLVQPLGIETILQTDLGRVRGAGKGVGCVTARPGPGFGRDGALIDHAAVLPLTTSRHQCGLSRVQAQGLVGHRVGLHQQGLGRWPTAVDDAAEHQTGDAFALLALCHRQLEPVVAGRGHAGAHGGATRVVALPGAGQVHVARGALLRRNADGPAAVGHVVPHQATACRGVHGTRDDKARDVAHLAVGVLGQANVLDQGVAGQVGVEFAKGAPCDLLISRARGAAGNGCALIDDDAGHAGLCGRPQAGGGHGQCEGGPGTSQLQG